MRRVLLASLALIALGWMSGCAGSNNSSSSGGSVTTQSNSLLNGQYGFALSGYDSSELPMGMAGSFKADGAGHITAGDVDVNDNGVISSSTALTGTYAFDAGEGPVGRILLTNTVGSVTHTLEFGFAVNSSGTFGSIMDLSANNFIIAGTMQVQNSSTFTLAALAGSYIVTLNGRNQSLPTSAIGRFTLGSSGATSNVSFDVSVSGSVVGTAGPTAGSVVTFAAAGMDANGRGTFTLALNDGGLTPAVTQNFAYYAISASRFVAVETDTGTTGTMLVDAAAQTIPASAVTTGSVFGMAGFDTINSSEISTVGQMQIASATSGTLALDSNDNGAINTVGALPIQTVSYNAATGRGVAGVASGVANGLANSLVFYLSGAGTGYIMDNTTGVTNRALGGTLSAQTGVGAFSVASDLPGASIIRAKGVAVSDAQAFAGEFGLTAVASTYALVADERFPTSPTTISTITDVLISPITVAALSASTGRGTLISGTETLVFYVVAPNQTVFIDISPVGNINNGPSPLFFATPD